MIGSGLPTNLSTVSFIARPALGPATRRALAAGAVRQAGIARDNGNNLEGERRDRRHRAQWRGGTHRGMARYVVAASYAWADARGLPFDDFALLSHSVQLEWPGARPLFLRAAPADPAVREPALVRGSAGDAAVRRPAQRGGRTAQLGPNFRRHLPTRSRAAASAEVKPRSASATAGDNLSVFRIVIGRRF